MCAALGVECEVLALADIESLQRRLDFLLQAAGRDNLVKGDAQLAVPAKPACRPDLQNRAFEMASLWQEEMIRNDKWLADNRVDWISLFVCC